MVLLPAPALIRVCLIGPAQSSIIVGPSHQGGQHQDTLLLLLAASVVGHITVVDHNDLEVSNLHWQVIHTKGKGGTSKAGSVHNAMRDLKPTLLVTVVVEPLIWDNNMELVGGNDCVV